MDFHDILFLREVKVFDNFLKSNKISVPILALRQQFFLNPDCPNIRYKEVISLFNKFGTKLKAFKLDKIEIEELDGHYIGTLHESNKKEKESYVNFTINGKRVNYYDGSTYHDIPIKRFNQLWTGILFCIEEQLETSQKIVDTAKLQNDAIDEYKNEVKIVKDWLSISECDEIINYFEQQELFQESLVDSRNKKATKSNYRTSYSGSLQEKDHPLFVQLFKKVCNLVNCPISSIETLQCVRYTENQFFDFHFDANNSNNRLYTLLIYLNDDFSGGETYFPEINLKIVPQRGMVVLFRNINDKGEIIINSYHKGEKVFNGIKYACNIWIKNFQG